MPSRRRSRPSRWSRSAARRCRRCPDASWGQVIVATGPLTSVELAQSIRRVTGEDALAFFDAIAPIVYRDTVDFEIAWLQSRYDKAGPGGTGADYVNCPLDDAQYRAFVDAVLAGAKHEFKAWESSTPYFEGCLPIEVMAERGSETLRFGPMKPVGLIDPRTGRRPFAVAQLRQDNALGTLFNMVGFQTKLTWAEQKRIFRMIPGLERAEFARLGGVHRNTFINSPRLLDPELRLKAMPHIRFAGQITGVEGYVESAAIGLLAGRFAAAEIYGEPIVAPPGTTALGALLAHITQRRRCCDVSADEHQLRAVPGARRERRQDRAQAGAGTTRARRPRRLACPAAPGGVSTPGHPWPWIRIESAGRTPNRPSSGTRHRERGGSPIRRRSISAWRR